MTLPSTRSLLAAAASQDITGSQNGQESKPAGVDGEDKNK
jgi:hypothetical protein